MKVQVTVVVTPTDPPGVSRVDSTTLLFTVPGTDDQEVVVANAARIVARRLGLGKPTRRSEGGR